MAEEIKNQQQDLVEEITGINIQTPKGSLKINLIAIVIILIVTVGGLVILEKTGVLDSIKIMVIGRDHHDDHRR